MAGEVLERTQVLLFYLYDAISDPAALGAAQERLGAALRLSGRVRVAAEGINGTVSGERAALEEYCAATRAQLGLAPGRVVDWKCSPPCEEDPFQGFSVRIVSDLVGGGPQLAYSAQEAGTHVDPLEFHALLAARPGNNVLLVDVRNAYEHQVGHFVGAVDPGTRKYSEFEPWIRSTGVELARGRDAVLLVCTGGVRCEKASIAFRRALRERLGDASPDVVQLRGGIHRYLEAVAEVLPPAASLFRGRNFVFDGRRVQPSAPPLAVVGRCCRCAAPWERFDEDRRCAKCRMLVLACDACARPPARLWCRAHEWLDGAKTSAEALLARRAELLARDMPPGRNARPQRQALRRQVDEIEGVLLSHFAGDAAKAGVTSSRSVANQPRPALASREQTRPAAKSCAPPASPGAPEPSAESRALTSVTKLGRLGQLDARKQQHGAPARA
jgi:UPF0176 protein